MCIEFRRYAKVELIRCPSAAETERRQTFRDEIVGQLPFDLIGMDDTLPSAEIAVSGQRAQKTVTMILLTLETMI